eukprot:gb/GECG01005873.1/.p1 GENE.gb/GECG01005873.1/~~gb/GECG01005873.1/.p1  ORF type:complete len:546 (+),score=60.21 gb/GECG01005873.1/:1-1638(+)
MAQSGRGIEAAYQALTSVISKGKLSSAQKDGVKLMRHWMYQVGIDMDKLSIVHIAGTKGKGSTAAMCESIFRHAGLSTGLFTSPHLVDVRERFRLNGKPVSEEKYLHHFWLCWDSLMEQRNKNGTLEDIPNVPSFFHLLTLVGFSLFSEEQVDVLVLEVGMGGRLDATNAIKHPTVCGITKLDYDHQHILGSTLEEIAGEKAGIIKPDCPVFSVRQTPGAEERIASIAGERNAPLHFVDEAWISGRLPSPTPSFWTYAAYQRENATLAVALAESFLQSKGIHDTKGNKELPKYFIDALQETEWPGRAQRLKVELPDGVSTSRREGITFYIDGAHTAQSMMACEAWYKNFSLKTKSTRVLLFNCSHEKNAVDLLLPLFRCNFGAVHIVPFDSSKPTSMDYKSTVDVIKGHPLFQRVKDDPALDQLIAEHSVTPESPQLTWQYTLASVCHVLPRLIHHFWDSIRDQGYDIDITEPNTIEVHRNIKEGLQKIMLDSFGCHVDHLETLKRTALHHDSKESESESTTQVLATGSLYLVGNTLQHLGWRAS